MARPIVVVVRSRTRSGRETRRGSSMSRSGSTSSTRAPRDCSSAISARSTALSAGAPRVEPLPLVVDRGGEAGHAVEHEVPDAQREREQPLERGVHVRVAAGLPDQPVDRLVQAHQRLGVVGRGGQLAHELLGPGALDAVEAQRGQPGRARAVLIGAGIVGNSLVHHLARLGWSDLVLLDKGPLPNPGGSTGHASNFIFTVDHSREMTALTLDSLRQYRELDVATICGGIEVARTEERIEELRRRMASAKSWAVDDV